DWEGSAAGELPPARLADQPPALLGRADPDRPLRRLRRGPGARGAVAGAAPGGGALPADGHRRIAVGPDPGVHADDLPPLRGSRAPGDGHNGRCGLLLLVLSAVRGPAQ